MSRCTGPDWKAQLPWVLLGMLTSSKEGLQVSYTEMVFGKAFAVPDELFPSSRTATGNDDISRLRQTIGKYQPCLDLQDVTSTTYFQVTCVLQVHLYKK